MKKGNQGLWGGQMRTLADIGGHFQSALRNKALNAAFIFERNRRQKAEKKKRISL